MKLYYIVYNMKLCLSTWLFNFLLPILQAEKPLLSFIRPVYQPAIELNPFGLIEVPIKLNIINYK